MPTREEADLLAGVRRAVAKLLTIDVKHTTADEILDRYAELMTP